MRRHRLDRLQKLAQGAAVISFGVMSTAACQEKAGTLPEEPLHTNATAQPRPDSTPSPDTTPHINATAPPMPTTSAAPNPTMSARPHTINAPNTPPSSNPNSNPLK